MINLKHRNFPPEADPPSVDNPGSRAREGVDFSGGHGVTCPQCYAQCCRRAAAATRNSCGLWPPNLNCVLILFYFLVLLCFSTKALGATNEVVDALPPATQASAVAQGAMADKSPEATPASPTHQGERDPFWPIGYVPPSRPGGTVAPANTNATEFVETLSPGASLSEMLKIGGVIRKGGKFYATINGFTVQTGEVVTVVADGEVYKFVVEKIDFEKVHVRPVGR